MLFIVFKSDEMEGIRVMKLVITVAQHLGYSAHANPVDLGEEL